MTHWHYGTAKAEQTFWTKKIFFFFQKNNIFLWEREKNKHKKRTKIRERGINRFLIFNNFFFFLEGKHDFDPNLNTRIGISER